MSVLKSERNEGNLRVFDACSKLTKYTIERCSSEKVFPKKTRWIMSNKVAEECIEAMNCIRRANSILVQSKSDYEYRRVQQNEAHAHINALIGLIEIAYTCFDVEVRVIEYWSKLAVETDSLLKAWMKSDKERNKKYL